MSSGALQRRVTKNLLEIQTKPSRDNPPVFAALKDDKKLEDITCLIVGAPDTPYHYGFFFFDMHIPSDFPFKPPVVKIKTTDSSHVRFNPNLYAEGKVCLSILGTWHGDTMETWSPTFSLEYILRAIQGMIMNGAPYYNEPGFEQKHKESAVLASQYSAKILHETLRVGVCDVLEGILSGTAMSPFDGDIKQQFLWRYDSYREVCEKNKGLDGSAFVKAPFEGKGNQCMGTFRYASLATRLMGIQEALLAETLRWRTLGEGSTPPAVAYTQPTGVGVDGVFCHPLSPSNPYLWHLGDETFALEVVFPVHDELERELPRVSVLSPQPLFHPNFTQGGGPIRSIPWLTTPRNQRRSLAHIYDAVRSLLKDPPLQVQVSWVNTEAAHCYFSQDPVQKALYASRNVPARVATGGIQKRAREEEIIILD